ncbi:hypothetical protein M3616_22895 [Bacillus velezensis]|nr:hypothetical protein [Bacillus velezensis]
MKSDRLYASLVRGNGRGRPEIVLGAENCFADRNSRERFRVIDSGLQGAHQ